MPVLTAGVREVYERIKAQAAAEHGDAIWLSRDGLDLFVDPLRAGGRGQGVVFRMNRSRADAPWINVIIHDGCVGGKLAMRDYMRPTSTKPERLMPLPGGPQLVFSQRAGYVEGDWRPAKFAAAGHDPVQVAARLIKAVLTPHVSTSTGAY
jgi:hypothetical protein